MRKLKQYEISVLLIEPDQEKRRTFEECLDYIGLSGRNLRDIAENEEEARRYLEKKQYHFVIGNIPKNVELRSETITVPTPKTENITDYLSFQESLITNLEIKFGFNYDY